jgi:hypothetical protein
LGGRAGQKEARMRMVQVLCLCAVAERISLSPRTSQS